MTTGKAYPYGHNNPDRLIDAPKNIKLISGERDIEDSENFQRAYELIEDAEHIFFLGFSFDETNLERLQAKRMRHKVIIATRHGLKSAKVGWVQDYFAKRSGTNIDLADKDALSLLQEYLKIE